MERAIVTQHTPNNGAEMVLSPSLQPEVLSCVGEARARTPSSKSAIAAAATPGTMILEEERAACGAVEPGGTYLYGPGRTQRKPRYLDALVTVPHTRSPGGRRH